jgi:ribosome-binding factor A
MSSRRTLKAASAIREVVSMAILTEIRDPRVRDVTVIQVEVAGDMRTAKVHVSIMGDEKDQEQCLNGLRRSAGFLQSRIKDRIETRYIPKLEFVLDQGVKQSLEVSRILKEVLPPSPDDDDDDAYADEIDLDETEELNEDGSRDLEPDQETPDAPSAPPRDAESP